VFFVIFVVNQILALVIEIEFGQQLVGQYSFDREVRLMTDIKVGVVKNYFAKPSVAAIEVTGGELQIGDVIRFKGHTTDFKQEVNSIQEEKQTIDKAVKGQLIGIQVKERVRENDLVYKVTD